MPPDHDLTSHKRSIDREVCIKLSIMLGANAVVLAVIAYAVGRMIAAS